METKNIIRHITYGSNSSFFKSEVQLCVDFLFRALQQVGILLKFTSQLFLCRIVSHTLSSTAMTYNSTFSHIHHIGRAAMTNTRNQWDKLLTIQCEASPPAHQCQGWVKSLRLSFFGHLAHTTPEEDHHHHT